MCNADLCVVLEIKFLMSTSRSPMTTCVSSSVGWLKRSPPVAFTRRRSFSSFFVGRPHRYSCKTNVKITNLFKKSAEFMILYFPLLTLQPSRISSAGQIVRSRLSMGSGISRRLMVTFVRAVSLTVMLALTEMWLKPKRDEPSKKIYILWCKICKPIPYREESKTAIDKNAVTQ